MDEIHAFAIAAGGHRFLLFYESGREAAALRQLGRWAANKSLPFTWLDAANLSAEIRQEREIREDLGTNRL